MNPINARSSRHRFILYLLLLSLGPWFPFSQAEPVSADAVYVTPNQGDSRPDPTDQGLQFHRVQKGETLSQIAKEYAVSLADLMAVNSISDADALRVNQRLYIPRFAQSTLIELPSEPAQSPLSLPEPMPPVSTTSLNRSYAVASGDTVTQIADRFGVEVQALMALNGIAPAETERLTIGQNLLLPATSDDLRVIPASKSYTVQSGDSLGLVAQRFGVSAAQLAQVNGISDPDNLALGRRLVIPAHSATAAPVDLGLAHGGFRIHRVRPGETLSQIARDFNSTIQALVAYNGLPDEQSVYWGLDLRIPYGPPQLREDLPPVPRSGTRFLISISRQQCWIVQGDRALHEWQCSTGQGEWVTRTGTFAVKTKLEMAQSSAYRLDMPYWLGIYDVGVFENGIHGLPILWSTGEKLWTELIGQPATFGCAMLTDDNAATLFDLAYLGMAVEIVK